MNRKCTKCGEVKDEEQFTLRRDTGKRVYRCKPCNALYRKAYYLANRERVRKKENSELDRYYRNRWKRIGIVDVDTIKIADLMELQSGKCAICGLHQSELRVRLHRDHDHKDGKTRGLLCHLCNNLLGLAADDAGRLMAAISYLSDPPARLLKII